MNRLGALLVIAAGFLLGLGGSRELGRTVRRREEFCWLLERIHCELEAFCCPLPELFAAMADGISGEGGALCRRISVGLSAPGGEPFFRVWATALEPVPRRERQILQPLGAVLGRYGVGEQLPAIALCRREMEQALKEARARRRDMGRVYIGLGTAGGLMLAVLLV